MSNEGQILEALSSAQGPLCDDCVTAVMGWNSGQRAHGVCSAMAESGTIVRAPGVCSRCGRRRIVNGVPLTPAGAAARPTSGASDKARLTMSAHAGVDTDVDTGELAETSAVAFGLERDLQIALRTDIQKLEAGLRVADDGHERVIEAGRVDITAVDAGGSTVVVQLKAGTAGPAALTQLLACMAALAGQVESRIRGVLVAGGFDPRLVSAARAVPNVQLRRYRQTFAFEGAE